MRKLAGRTHSHFPTCFREASCGLTLELRKRCFLSGAGTDSRCLFLIEHSKGLNCCRLQPSGKNRVIPLGGSFHMLRSTCSWMKKLRS